MKAAKKLSLKRERLTELSSDELVGIAGGADAQIYIRTTYTLTCNCTNTCQNVTAYSCTCTCCCGHPICFITQYGACAQVRAAI